MGLPGFAPGSLCDNNSMLRTYTTGPGPRIECKIEKALLQGLFLRHTAYARSVYEHPVVAFIILPYG